MPSETFQVLIDGREVVLVHDLRGLRIADRDLDVSLVETAPGHYSLLLDGRSLRLSLERGTNGVHRLRTPRGPVQTEVLGRREQLLRLAGGGGDRSVRSAPLKAPMPGLIVRVLVAPGDEVATGDPLVVLEAMKMENEICAAHDGRVTRVHAEPGGAVGKNALLIEFEDR